MTIEGTIVLRGRFEYLAHLDEALLVEGLDRVVLFHLEPEFAALLAIG